MHRLRRYVHDVGGVTMAWTRYQPQELGRPLASGECSVSQRGAVTFALQDLVAAGIGDRVVAMVNPELLAIGLRAPRENEATLGVYNANSKSSRKIALGGAIQSLGLSCEQVTGRRQIGRDDSGLLLVLRFADVTAQERAELSHSRARKNAAGGGQCGVAGRGASGGDRGSCPEN